MTYKVFILYANIQSSTSIINSTALDSVAKWNLHAGHLYSSLPALYEAQQADCHASLGLHHWVHLCNVTSQPLLLLPIHPHGWPVN